MTETEQNPEPQDETDTQILVPSGRSRTGPNALVHGLYATDIVMPWESKEDFEKLWRDLKEEWLPIGRQEYETVLSLAHMNWLKHRLMRTTQIAFRSDPFLSELQKEGLKLGLRFQNSLSRRQPKKAG